MGAISTSKFVRGLIRAMLIAGAMSVPITVTAVPVVFFGEDLGPRTGATADPLGIPNSIAARDAFLSKLNGFGQETLESFSTPVKLNSVMNELVFSGTNITGDASGGSAVDNRTLTFPRVPISGNKLISTGGSIRIEFSSPVAAFGTFITDAFEADNDANDPVFLAANPGIDINSRPGGIIDGIFRLSTERSPNNFEIFGPVRDIQPTTNRGVIFFGVIDVANPFENVVLFNGAAGIKDPANPPPWFSDGFGYDELYVATAAQVRTLNTPAPLGNNVAQLVTSSPASISQMVVVPNSPFSLQLDYLFPTLTGVLDVILGGVSLGEILAPNTLQSDFMQASFLVDNSSLLGVPDAVLEFVLNGPTGSKIWLDNIAFPGLVNGGFDFTDLNAWTTSGSASVLALRSVPEPTTILLLAIGLAGLGFWRRLLH